MDAKFYKFSEIRENAASLDEIVLYFILLMAPTYYRDRVWDPFFPSDDGFILKQWFMTAWLLDCPEGWRYVFASTVLFMKIYATLNYFTNSKTECI